MVIVDCHTHLNNYDPGHPDTLAERVERIQAAMARSGTDHAIVLTSYAHTPERPSTREVVDALEGNPRLSVVAGVSFLHYKQRDLWELADFLEAGRIRGLKLYPGYEPFYPHDPRLRVVYELAGEYQVPVMIHTGDTWNPKAKIKYAHPLQVDEVAVDFPDVKFIVCHLGNPWFRDCMEVVYKNKNVYADFSGLALGDFSTRFQRYLKQQLDEFLLYAGEPRWLLYGTDWPIGSMSSYVAFMNGLKMPQRDKNRILYENACELFKIPVPAAPAGPAPAPASPPPAEPPSRAGHEGTPAPP